ncbi:choice-of-anchor A family protein [Saccharophagus degradans]|uniref:Choice-of-anchor A family protein n=1 Tax=Saccharophagus degradans TaxID=86304 RepID=A0AAW7XE43_9GAMM|nr:choice-of-anchor A family protein [Saccharophagus degradans]MDO6424813.1 choice-of-anchor A family protein [Saccharophagus degradans]MDO6609697.1 choice-of-anchor A family protein [Saccharophagus degradans]
MFSRILTKATAGFAGLVLSATVFASPLSEYNLILLEDYNFQGGDVEGRTFIGGDLNAAGMGADFASRVPTLNIVDSVNVVGDVTAANINVQHGNFVHGGNLNANVNLNGAGSVIHNPSLSISSIADELFAQSLTYSGLAANGTFNNVPNNSSFDYLGTDPLAVFSVDAADVFAQNNSLRLNSGNAETVIINVAGTDITVNGGVNLVDGFRQNDISFGNIIWNFFEAETINFGNLAMAGSVLAPFADITGGAVFEGSVAAESYTGGREFHRFLFNTPNVSVPEPGPLSLLMLGIGFIALSRARAKQA